LAARAAQDRGADMGDIAAAATMAEFQWVIICERVLTEQPGKTLSFISILERVSVPAPPPELLERPNPPLVPFRYCTVSQWVRSKPTVGERVPGRLLLYGPNGKEFGKTEFVVDLTETPRARIIAQASGFPLLGAGTYPCVVQTKARTTWRTVGQADFEVVYTDPAARRPSGSRH